MEAAVHKLPAPTDTRGRLIVPSRSILRNSPNGACRPQCSGTFRTLSMYTYTPHPEWGRVSLTLDVSSVEGGRHTHPGCRCGAKQTSHRPNGSAMEEMRTLAVTLNADVTFSGHLGGQQLHHVIRSCRAVCALEWYENAPVSLLEAYALGKPVIGARIGGIPE